MISKILVTLFSTISCVAIIGAQDSPVIDQASVERATKVGEINNQVKGIVEWMEKAKSSPATSKLTKDRWEIQKARFLDWQKEMERTSKNRGTTIKDMDTFLERSKDVVLQVQAWEMIAADRLPQPILAKEKKGLNYYWEKGMEMFKKKK